MGGEAEGLGRCIDSAAADCTAFSGTCAGHAGAGAGVAGVMPAPQAAWASAASVAPNAARGPRKFFGLMAVPPQRHVTSTTRTSRGRARLRRARVVTLPVVEIGVPVFAGGHRPGLPAPSSRRGPGLPRARDLGRILGLNRAQIAPRLDDLGLLTTEVVLRDE